MKLVKNVSIEKLLETNLVCYESVEDEYIREEDERQALPKTMDIASEIMQVLTPLQRSRYIKSKMYGKSTYAIAAEEDCDHKAVLKASSQLKRKSIKSWQNVVTKNFNFFSKNRSLKPGFHRYG